MLNDFIMYAALVIAAIASISVLYSAFKDKSMSWLAALLIGLIGAYLLLSGAQVGNYVANTSNSIALLLRKGIYFLGFSGG